MSPLSLDRLELKGFKSIRECDIEFRRINILIGANGSGKSNLIQFFRMVQAIYTKHLQLFVAKHGHADALLHFGRKHTESISAKLTFGKNSYEFALEPTNSNQLVFSSEIANWGLKNGETRSRWLGSGHAEIQSFEDSDTTIIERIRMILTGWQVFHFHDTRDNSPIDSGLNLKDNRTLRPDARNLGPFLKNLSEQYKKHYEIILSTIRLVAPYFGEIIFEVISEYEEDNVYDIGLLVHWTEHGEDEPFSLHQLSDGTLRFICLATLLLQPDELKPSTIIIDEPELGLHPAAIQLLASMIRVASQTRQVIVATQSVDLINEFGPEDIIVADRVDHCSVFTRPTRESLATWLEDYSLGELWLKNILGGRPSL